MEDYRANSMKAKSEAQVVEESSEKKVVDKVVTSPVKTKKKGKFAKLVDSLVKEDAVTIKQYIVKEVLDPAIRKTAQDVVTNILDMALWGKNGGAKPRPKSAAGQVSYRNYYNGQPAAPQPVRKRAGTSTYLVDDIVINTRGEAEEVLARMEELLESYGTVSVADYYDLVDITGKHTDNKYGWNDLSAAYIVKAFDGYVIKLPRTIPLD